MEKAVDAVEAVRRALAGSEAVDMVRRAQRASRPDRGRPLRSDEIEALERHRNTSDDWSRIHVSDEFHPDRVYGCHFTGRVYLGNFRTDVELVPGVRSPAGVYQSNVHDSAIEDGALVRRVGLLSGYVVESGALISACGTVATTGPTTFGAGMELGLALETGGREVRVYPEITLDAAAEVAGRRGDRTFLDAYRSGVNAYMDAIRSERGLVSSGAVVEDTARVRNTLLGSFARIRGATVVREVTMLSNREEQTTISNGACVEHALLQWGAEVTTLGVVERSVLCEHAHVERHGKLLESLIGPNTGVAEGEVAASLVGPFVGFHHQALLIAAYWPEGKGNVSHGANVGSNHTARSPDQEIRPGEGTFFGLGVDIKFPTDFSRAPYSIVATGASLLPQKVEFPFSLIKTPSVILESVNPAYNEILPGWVLSDNIYAIRRNERKYKARNKARRHAFVFEIFRPDTARMMEEARARLERAGGKPFYLDSDIRGIGKNYLLEANRSRGVEAYTLYLRYYALTAFKHRLEAVGGAAERILDSDGGDAAWAHARSLLKKEFPKTEAGDLLDQLVAIYERIAKDNQAARTRDDVRGGDIIEDYAEVHAAAADDPVVRAAWDEADAMRKEVEALRKRL